MESQLLRSDCLRCGQRRVLGLQLRRASQDEMEIEFRCCACVDEHGDGPLAASVDQAGSSTASNWWASSEPPARLSDVPLGYLEKTDINFSVGGLSHDFAIWTDPDQHYFVGHGGERVWPASLVLARHLLAKFTTGTNLKVVELGAGTGLPGLALSRLGAQVVLTDLPWIVELCEYNIQANFDDDIANLPSTKSLRWGNAPDMSAVLAALGEAPDLLVAADVVYRPEDMDSLISTIQSLRAREALLAVIERGGVVAMFRERLTKYGWHVEATEVDTNGIKALLLNLTPAQHGRGNRRISDLGSAALPTESFKRQKCQRRRIGPASVSASDRGH